MTEKKARRTLRALRRVQLNAQEWQNAIRRNVYGSAEKYGKALEVAENTRAHLIRAGINPDRFYV